MPAAYLNGEAEGVGNGPRRLLDNRYAGLFAGVMLFYPLVYYLTFTTDEYRIPIEPLLLILGTYALFDHGAHRFTLTDGAPGSRASVAR